MGKVKTDRRGVEYVVDGEAEALPPGWLLCLGCGRAWNDAKVTSVTPTPSARCPFEDLHLYDDDDDGALTRAELDVIADAITTGDAPGEWAPIVRKLNAMRATAPEGGSRQ